MVEYVVEECTENDDPFCVCHLISRHPVFGDQFLGSWFMRGDAQDAADALTAQQARRLQSEANYLD